MPSSACCVHHLALPPFPTRRSSDLSPASRASFSAGAVSSTCSRCRDSFCCRSSSPLFPRPASRWFKNSASSSRGWRRSLSSASGGIDRKSARLNSSHLGISYAVFCLLRPPPRSPPFPYTTLFRSLAGLAGVILSRRRLLYVFQVPGLILLPIVFALIPTTGLTLVQKFGIFFTGLATIAQFSFWGNRSEERTSELQSLRHLVCRLLLAASTTSLSPLSLHDALPISRRPRGRHSQPAPSPLRVPGAGTHSAADRLRPYSHDRPHAGSKIRHLLHGAGDDRSVQLLGE